mmetsp:Transcript_40009/g.96269  ORF Transcript_40009/g.96269 Transcript_40009/m.96269 type:complete len:260 (+) Transcript_40009:733-1512(+)
MEDRPRGRASRACQVLPPRVPPPWADWTFGIPTMILPGPTPPARTSVLYPSTSAIVPPTTHCSPAARVPTAGRSRGRASLPSPVLPPPAPRWQEDWTFGIPITNPRGPSPDARTSAPCHPVVPRTTRCSPAARARTAGRPPEPASLPCPALPRPVPLRAETSTCTTSIPIRIPTGQAENAPTIGPWRSGDRHMVPRRNAARDSLGVRRAMRACAGRIRVILASAPARAVIRIRGTLATSLAIKNSLTECSSCHVWGEWG